MANGELTIGPYTGSEKKRLRDYELALASQEPESFLFDLVKSRVKELMQPADMSPEARQERLDRLVNMASGMTGAIGGITREEMGGFLAQYMKAKKVHRIKKMSDEIAETTKRYKSGEISKEEADSYIGYAKYNAEEDILDEADRLADTLKHTPDEVLARVRGTSIKPHGIQQEYAAGMMGWDDLLFLNPKYDMTASELFAHEVPGHVGERMVSERLKTSKIPLTQQARMADVRQLNNDAYNTYRNINLYLSHPDIPKDVKDQLYSIRYALHKSIPLEQPAKEMESLPYKESHSGFVELLRSGLRKMYVQEPTTRIWINKANELMRNLKKKYGPPGKKVTK